MVSETMGVRSEEEPEMCYSDNASWYDHFVIPAMIALPFVVMAGIFVAGYLMGKP